MKSLRIKMLALAGTGAFMLQVAGCAPIDLITGLLGNLAGLLPSA